MALPSAYAKYNNNKVMTASPAELTLMLYEGAIKFTNIAIEAIKHKNIKRAHQNIIKVQNIVEYLRNTLNMEYAVAQDFDRMYDYLQRRLFEANVGKDVAMLEEVNRHMHSICNTWKEVMRIGRMKGQL